METVKYLCEFFFCEGFSSFMRLLIVGMLFYVLSPKININQVFSRDETDD